jgi:hypothetical protein
MNILRSVSRAFHAEWGRYAFCTIATEDFLPWALVLFDSIARHHPGARRVLLYVHREGEGARQPVIEGVDAVPIRAVVDAEAEADLRRRYNIAEFCFALKPALLDYCVRKQARHAVYLDSDIDVLAPLDAVDDALAAHSVLLTPHLDAPIPMDGNLPSDLTILRAGACNLGFVAIKDDSESREVLRWWSERIRRWGYVAPEHGYQGDQKWMDLAPALFPCVSLLRHKGSNVGGWNLHSRKVRLVGGHFLVGSERLAFFHFSGFDPERPEILSRYQNRFRLAELPAVARLAHDFARRLLDARPQAAALAWKACGEASSRREASATCATGPLAEDAYRAAFEVAVPPDAAFATGEAVVVRVRVVNASVHPWPVARSADGAGGIALSWHIRREGGEVVSWENARHFLPADLAPGEGVDMHVAVRTPDRTGRYLIEFDMVHEGTAWFSSRGSGTASVSLSVGLFNGPPG